MVEESILPLLGEPRQVLQPRKIERNSTGGGDIDCGVWRLDPWWPLRLPSGWRLCQCLRYDLTGWYWILDGPDGVLAIDTLDDRLGVGRYAFPTSWLGSGDGNYHVIRAVYLTLKRLRKRVWANAEWVNIRDLVGSDVGAYENLLGRVLGTRLAHHVADVVLAGSPPGSILARSARIAQSVARVWGPGRALRWALLASSRLVERLMRPTGMVVVLAGPDGAGKSTLADALPALCRGLFRRHGRFHWRPALLPRLGAFLGRPVDDATRPHAGWSHGRLVSPVVVLYYWLDFLVGYWLRIWPLRLRTGLVVMERGWWDMGIDPTRYRLRIAPRLVRGLGWLLPKPDLLLVLDSPTAVLLKRKQELPAEELERQREEWAALDVPRVQKVVLDSSLLFEQFAAGAREAVVSFLERRAVARLGAGWANLPSRRSPRWWLPRGPRRVAAAALAVYQPVTPRGLAAWSAARGIAFAGGFQVLPMGEAPPREVRELVAPHVPARTTYAVMRANHPGRFVALLLGERGDFRGLAKVATTASGHKALAREAEALQQLGPKLPAPLRAPRVLAAEDGLLLMEAVAWRPRRRPWALPEEVAAALGGFWAVTGAAHGDVAPWNLLRLDDGWVLCDWEATPADGRPFEDVFHYLVQAHALLGRPSGAAILAALRGGGWVGSVLRAYAVAAGLSLDDGRGALAEYLRRTSRTLDPHTADGRRGGVARQDLLTALEASR